MNLFLRSRVVPLLFIAATTAATWLGPWVRDASAEAKLSILTRAWLTATISMPAASTLLEPRVQQAPPHREAGVIAEALKAAAAPAPALTAPERIYPEVVILRALRHGDSAFGRCWSRARREDIVAPRKARLHLEVDPTGVVRVARAGLDDDREAQPALGAEVSSLPDCISRVGRRLPFPATGKAMKLSLLLLR